MQCPNHASTNCNLYSKTYCTGYTNLVIKQITGKKILISCVALCKVSKGNVQQKIMNKIAILCFEFLSKRFRPGPSSVELQYADWAKTMRWTWRWCGNLKIHLDKWQSSKMCNHLCMLSHRITFSFCRVIITILSLPELSNSFIVMFSHLNNLGMKSKLY